MPISRRDALTVAIAAGVGVVSGVLSHIIPRSMFEIGANKQGWLVSALISLSPGIIYGVAIGLYLRGVGVASIVRATAYMPFVVAAWFSVLWYTSGISDGPFISIKMDWQTGVVMGLIGASIMALAALILLPFFRRWNLAVATVIVGGVAGMSLSIDFGYGNFVVVFTIWQGAVTACFGWGVARARAS